eukprot:939071-Pleurochrysis_carterae.AAC.1
MTNIPFAAIVDAATSSPSRVRRFALHPLGAVTAATACAAQYVAFCLALAGVPFRAGPVRRLAAHERRSARPARGDAA